MSELRLRWWRISPAVREPHRLCSRSALAKVSLSTAGYPQCDKRLYLSTRAVQSVHRRGKLPVDPERRDIVDYYRFLLPLRPSAIHSMRLQFARFHRYRRK